jgi:hypothetical protein
MTSSSLKIKTAPLFLATAPLDKDDEDEIANIFKQYEEDEQAGNNNNRKRNRPRSQDEEEDNARGGGGGVGRGGGGASMLKRRIVDESIHNEFKADPLAAIQRVVAPYHAPEDLDEFAGDVAKLAEWEAHMKKVEDKLWNHAEVKFIRSVEAKTKDHTLLVRLRLQPIPGVMSEMNNKIVESQLNLNPQGNNNRNNNNNNQQQQQQNVVLATGGGAQPDTMTNLGVMPANVAAFRRPDPTMRPSEAARQLQAQQNLRRLMEAPEVSGEYKMSDLLRSAVMQSLSQLRIKNPLKFSNVTPNHFYADELVMDLFAEIVAANIKITKVQNPTAYVNDVVEPRREAQRDRLVGRADEQLIMDHYRRCFVFGTSQQIFRNQQAITERYLESMGSLN